MKVNFEILDKKQNNHKLNFLRNFLQMKMTCKCRPDPYRTNAFSLLNTSYMWLTKKHKK